MVTKEQVNNIQVYYSYNTVGYVLLKHVFYYLIKVVY